MPGEPFTLSVHECIRSSNLSIISFLGTGSERKLLSLGPDSVAMKDTLKKFMRRCAILSVLRRTSSCSINPKLNQLLPHGHHNPGLSDNDK